MKRKIESKQSEDESAKMLKEERKDEDLKCSHYYDDEWCYLSTLLNRKNHNCDDPEFQEHLQMYLSSISPISKMSYRHQDFTNKYIVPSTCFTKNGGYYPTKLLGKGFSGAEVYQACKDNTADCNYAVKIGSVIGAKDEEKMARLMGDSGIGPKVFAGYTCPVNDNNMVTIVEDLYSCLPAKKYFMVQDKLDITLKDWANENVDKPSTYVEGLARIEEILQRKIKNGI